MVGRKGKDLVFRFDLVAEDLLEQLLLEKGYCLKLLSEERGERILGRGEPIGYLVADPLDGSLNFSRGIPFYCSSLAYSSKLQPKMQDLELGVIITPHSSYHAIKGRGWYADGTPGITQRHGPRKLFSYYGYQPIQLKLDWAARSLGSIAYELCLLAQGKLDGVIDLRGWLRGFDIAAAQLILAQAGGILTDLEGNPIQEVGSPSIQIVAAMDPGIHSLLLSKLKK